MSGEEIKMNWTEDANDLRGSNNLVSKVSFHPQSRRILTYTMHILMDFIAMLSNER